MNRVKDLRERRGLTQAQLAVALDVHQTAVSQWENQRTKPDTTSLAKLAEFFGVSTDYVLGRDKPRFQNQNGLIRDNAASKGVKIPVLGRVQAGIPIEAVQDVLGYEEITPEMAIQGEHFALCVRGDSMAPMICEGDVVIVRKQFCAENGDAVVVMINRQDATIKRFFKDEQGIKLLPLNPAYEPFFFAPAQVKDLPVIVIGKVVEMRRKF